MNPRLSLNTQILSRVTTKVLNSTIQKERKVLIVFDDIMSDMISNKKFHSVIAEIFVSGPKAKYFFGLYYPSLFSCTKRCNAKHHKPHHEDSKQTRASTDCH